MVEKPVFIQGLFSYVGSGLGNPARFSTPVTYLVPPDRRAQTVYFRAGNPLPELIYIVLTRRGTPMRYFPVGARSGIHVPLAVLEDIPPGSSVELLVAAPRGVESTVLIDVGFMEIV
jgi:hypothetical protein